MSREYSYRFAKPKLIPLAMNPQGVKQQGINQKGMALLTILLLVVAITIVAGSMLASQKVMQRQYALTLNQDQMREYALSGEAIASQLIAQSTNTSQTSQTTNSDSLQDGLKANLKDSWEKPLPPFVVGNATLTIKISDEAEKFNLNNLYHDGKVDEQAMAFFERLLINQHINPAIANAVLDWQDPDSDTRAQGGAEYDFYQSTGKAMPIPIANQPFVSVAELASVRGVERADFEKLKPLVTAVPFFLPINVNTAKPELLLALFSPKNTNPTAATGTQTPPFPATPSSSGATTTPITPDISPSQIESWAKMRATSPAIHTMNDFWALPMLKSVSDSQKQSLQTLMDVKSQAFSDVIKVTVDNRDLYLTSLLAKKATSIPANTTQNTAGNPQNSGLANTPTTAPQSVIAFNRRFLPFLTQAD